MPARSKYALYARGRVGREKKRIARPGAREDANRWFKCWQCGQTLDKNRTAVVDGYADGNAPVFQQIPPGQGVLAGYIPNPQANFLLNTGAHVMLANNFTEWHVTANLAQSGCPQCGTLNSL